MVDRDYDKDCPATFTGKTYEACYHNGKKIEELENTFRHHEEKFERRLEELENKLIRMDREYAVAMEHNATAFENMTTVMKELSDNNTQMRSTLDHVEGAMQSLSERVSLVTEQIGSANRKFEGLEEKVQEIDNKGKIDIVTIKRDGIKDKLAPFLVGGGIVGIVFWILQMIGH